MHASSGLVGNDWLHAIAMADSRATNSGCSEARSLDSDRSSVTRCRGHAASVQSEQQLPIPFANGQTWPIVRLARVPSPLPIDRFRSSHLLSKECFEPILSISQGGRWQIDFRRSAQGRQHIDGSDHIEFIAFTGRHLTWPSNDERDTYTPSKRLRLRPLKPFVSPTL